LVACAHFDAFVVGADIDYKLLHGIGNYAPMISYLQYDKYNTIQYTINLCSAEAQTVSNVL